MAFGRLLLMRIYSIWVRVSGFDTWLLLWLLVYLGKHCLPWCLLLTILSSVCKAMALVWLFFQQVPLALLPFTIYSIFHVAGYIRTNLIPTFQPPKSSTGASPGGRPAKSTSPLAEQIGNFIKRNYDSSMMLVASLELFLWFRVLFSAILFTKGSWILLAIYTVFIRARYSQCSFVQNAVSQGSARIDALVSAQGTPPAVRQIWGTIKQFVRQGTEATNIGRYIQPHEAGGKKAQ